MYVSPSKGTRSVVQALACVPQRWYNGDYCFPQSQINSPIRRNDNRHRDHHHGINFSSHCKVPSAVAFQGTRCDNDTDAIDLKPPANGRATLRGSHYDQSPNAGHSGPPQSKTLLQPCDCELTTPPLTLDRPPPPLSCTHGFSQVAVSYTHLTLPTNREV